ncbi:MAG: GerMN domain-containing protein [Desulfitobacteriaceae bacterium]
MKRVIFIGVVVLLSVFWTTGCGTLETLLQKSNSQDSLGSWIGGEAANVPALVNTAEGKTVSLYFADSSGKYLIKEERTLPKTLSLARETVNQWLKGPLGKNTPIQPLVSPTTALLDIAIKDGVATVDLNKEFIKPYQKITSEIEIYGLVNTLTQFSSIREVRILIEGKMLNKLGNIDTTHLTSKPSLIKGTAEVKPVLTTPSSTLQGTLGNNSAKGRSLTDSPSTINLFAFPPSST